ncbi:MAG: recombinase family protein [Oscillospiraceae bacterium]|nr:recombinase family protein [Oscillospiraceae bacterium]
MKDIEKKQNNSANHADQKRIIRERYKGVDQDSLNSIPSIPRKEYFKIDESKRVAVYARVGVPDPRQTSSDELFKQYYIDIVSRMPEWKLVDFYIDEGSWRNMDAFKKMMLDCKAGKIDLIIVKTVSRFAPTVDDAVRYVNELKKLTPPVGVFFECEYIYTLDSGSEKMLSFLLDLEKVEIPVFTSR